MEVEVGLPTCYVEVEVGLLILHTGKVACVASYPNVTDHGKISE